MPASPSRAPGAARSALAARIDLRDGFPRDLDVVAGLAGCRDRSGRGFRAAAVLLDAGTLHLVGSHVASGPDDAAGGDASGEETPPIVPVLLAALAGLPRTPDLAFVEGHGIAHPQGAGIAAHVGVLSGVPSIGVAGDILLGSGPETHETRGAYTALRDAGRRQIGWLLRSRPGSPPLVVSPAHRVALASAADLVMRFTRGHRLPEPLRLAHAMAHRPPGANPLQPQASDPEQ